ncbi:MAG: hypothetical protein RR131_01065 [Anaerovorax sp.]
MENCWGKINIKKHKRGFITVEAAIFLPVFLIGMLTLVYLIKILWMEEKAFFAFEQEAKFLAKTAYGVSKEAYPAQGKAFELKVKGKLFHQMPFSVKNVNFKGSRYFYKQEGTEGLILAQLHYEAPLRLPVQLHKNLNIDETLLLRGFIGADEIYPPMGFEEMEKDKPFEPVWVFPRKGERFHKQNCTYICNKPKQMYVTEALKKQYDSCKLCQSAHIFQGGIVYCFTKTGQVYHSGTCKAVEKYVVEMNKEEAISRGYTPCMKCGGG